jgi:hypothetical protein
MVRLFSTENMCWAGGGHSHNSKEIFLEDSPRGKKTADAHRKTCGCF